MTECVINSVYELPFDLIFYVYLFVLLLLFFFFAGEVIFNQMQPDFPPDFIFGPQDQEFVPNIDKMEVWAR